MSLLPMLFDLVDTEPLFEDSFGFGMYPDEIYRPIISRERPTLHISHWPSIYKRPWVAKNKICSKKGKELATKNGGKSLIGKDGFQVCVDVEQFAPNELSVKTVDNTIVVEGKHEEKEDEHGHIYRHFIRRYELPKDYEVKDVVSTLSSDGVLTIKAAPPTKEAIESNERVIQIQQTGPAHLTVKENPASKDSEEKMTE